MRDRSAPVYNGILGVTLYSVVAGVEMTYSGARPSGFISGYMVIAFLIGYAGHRAGGWNTAALSAVAVQSYELLVLGPVLYLVGLRPGLPEPHGMWLFPLIFMYCYSFALFFGLMGALASRVRNGETRQGI